MVIVIAPCSVGKNQLRPIVSNVSFGPAGDAGAMSVESRQPVSLQGKSFCAESSVSEALLKPDRAVASAVYHVRTTAGVSHITAQRRQPRERHRSNGAHLGHEFS